jgi:hypothetical protein
VSEVEQDDVQEQEHEPRGPIVHERDIHKAVDFLARSARDIGDARRRLIRAEHMVKHTEALEFQMAEGSSAEARKNAARASDAYLDAINEEALAAGEFEKLKALREAAAMKIECWRSEQATLRSIKI